MATDDALNAADAGAREDALDVRRSFIVQAPAGSGKTELLIQRYLRLLAIVDEPEEILAITFTRKAAAEVRQRIVAALERAARNDVPEQDHERVTFRAARVALDRDRERGWELVKVSWRMRMQTLDALCAGIVRSLPVTSGLGTSGGIVQDAEAERLYRKAAQATLDWLVDDEEAGRAVATVLEHLDTNTSAYIDYLAAMLQSRDQWLGIVGSGNGGDAGRIRARLEQNIADVVRHALSRARRRLARAAPADLVELAHYAAGNLVDDDRGRHPAAVLRDDTGFPGETAAALPAWRGLVELLLTREGAWRRRLTKAEGFPPGDDGQKASWLAVIEQLARDPEMAAILQGVRDLPDARYSDRQWDVLLALFRVLPLAVSELKRVFADRGVSDHAEVALAAGVALGRPDAPGDLAMMLDYRIRHLLVDEMQDTSISQYRLLETLTAGWTAGDGRSFFCVGDPMQSIYRFRNAEVGQFVRARARGLDNLRLEALTLRRNFRSGEHLVNWFNATFARVLPGEDDAATGAVSYSESVPVAALRGRGTVRVHPLFDADAETEAEYSGRLVESCLDTAQPGEDVAVLVRSRTQLPELLAELRQRSIAYEAVEIDRLTDLAEIVDLLALTRSLGHPDDRAAWLALLRGPLVGLAWTDLHRLVSGAPRACVWDLLNDTARVGRLSTDARRLLPPFIDVMGRALAADGLSTLRRRVETTWYRLGGPACLHDTDEIANACRFLDAIEGIEVAGTLDDPARLQRLLEDVRVSSPTHDDCRVRVMTMHKAKGLQFDHVVLPSLGRYTAGSRRAVLNWLNVPADAGGSDLVLSPVGPGYELENDPLYRYIETAKATSDRLELDRLLYVACTRARQSLHLVGTVALTDGRDDLRPPDSRSLLSRLWPALEAEIQEQFSQLDVIPAARPVADDDVLVQPVLKRRASGWTMPAPPPLPDVSPRGPGGGGDPDEVTYDWVGAVARDAGTIVHRWLHLIATGDDIPAQDGLEATDGLTCAWARTLGVSDRDMDSVVRRVREALAGILGDERGRWILGGEGMAELPLTGACGGRIESVVIDRVRLEGDTHWIIDYKTSSHEGGNVAGFIDQEADRYGPQLERYATLYRAFSGTQRVRTALYFPLMQTFRIVGE